MEALGIARGQYVVKVNNRKVLDGVLESIGIGGDENASRRLTVLRAIDKLDKFGFEGIKLLLGEGRKDESGDFTKGAGLQEGDIEKIKTFLTARDVVQLPIMPHLVTFLKKISLCAMPSSGPASCEISSTIKPHIERTGESKILGKMLLKKFPIAGGKSFI